MFQPTYSQEIMNASLPKTFKMPNLVIYDEKGDPNEHLDVFRFWMDFEQVSSLARCRTFPLTLAGPVQAWHIRLESCSISSFEQLATLFVTHLNGDKPIKKPATHLISVRQRENESLEAYTKRYNHEVMLVEDFIDHAAIQAILNGLHLEPSSEISPKTLPAPYQESSRTPKNTLLWKGWYSLTRSDLYHFLRWMTPEVRTRRRKPPIPKTQRVSSSHPRE